MWKIRTLEKSLKDTGKKKNQHFFLLNFFRKITTMYQWKRRIRKIWKGFFESGSPVWVGNKWVSTVKTCWRRIQGPTGFLWAEFVIAPQATAIKLIMINSGIWSSPRLFELQWMRELSHVSRIKEAVKRWWTGLFSATLAVCPQFAWLATPSL